MPTDLTLNAYTRFSQDLPSITAPQRVGGVDHWANTLDSGQASRSAVVLGFSEGPERQSRTTPTIGGEQPDKFGIKLS